jgi:branched-subunit amino acid aminotransferase/4-amino-4-deoxychorismate lyase
VTPPSECGLLPGVMRAELLARGQLREETIRLPELRQAVREGRRVCCMNSVRGVYDVGVQWGPPGRAAAAPSTAWRGALGAIGRRWCGKPS